MKGIRPDRDDQNDTARTSALELVEAKTCAFCPDNYGTRFATNGNIWMEARAHKAVKQRDGTAAALGEAVGPIPHCHWPSRTIYGTSRRVASCWA
jgi:hypothetical protein